MREKQSDTDAYSILKASCAEIGKRCMKHQKGELDGKRQLAVYQTFVVSSFWNVQLNDYEFV